MWKESRPASHAGPARPEIGSERLNRATLVVVGIRVVSLLSVVAGVSFQVNFAVLSSLIVMAAFTSVLAAEPLRRRTARQVLRKMLYLKEPAEAPAATEGKPAEKDSAAPPDQTAPS